MNTNAETVQGDEQSPSMGQSGSLRRPPVWGEESQIAPTGDRYTAVSVLACLLFAVTLTGVTGPVGVLAGLLTGSVWYLLGPPYAIAAGTVLAVSAIPVPASLLDAALVGGPLLVLVLAPVASTPSPRGFVAVAFITTGVCAMCVWLLAELVAAWLIALALLGAIGVGAYAGHRYLLLALGLVPTAAATETRPRTDER